MQTNKLAAPKGVIAITEVRRLAPEDFVRCEMQELARTYKRWESSMPRRIRQANVRRRKHFLREAREHAFPGASIEEVAEKFDMSAAQMSRIERGHSPFTEDFLDLAEYHYGVPREIMLTRPPTAENELLWSLWGKATPSQRQVITEIAKIIIEKGA